MISGSIITNFKGEPNVRHFRHAAFVIFTAALIMRLVFAFFEEGCLYDLNCFGTWAVRVFSVGFKDFYSADIFTDYPPGYMYILYPIGALISKLGIPYYSGLWLLLLKLPSIICDIAAGLLIFKEGKKHISSGSALLLTCAYLFNPCILLNSSIWGQVDSILALFIICTCLALVYDKMPAAYIIFAAGVIFKPQILILSPVLISGFIDHVILNGFSFQKLLKNLLAGIFAMLLPVLLSMPFGIGNVISQYTETLGSYPYASVNAYNFWSFLGLNWTDQNTSVMLVPIRVWGATAIILVTAVSISVPFLYKYLYKYKKNRETRFTEYPLLAAFIFFTVFTFSARMHERYLYPALLCLIFAYIYRPSWRLFNVYVLASVFHFGNTAHILYFYDPDTYDVSSGFVRLISFGTICCTFYLYYVILSEALSFKTSNVIRLKSIINVSSFLNKTENNLKLKKPDIFLMLFITLIYSMFALYDLGDHKAPSTVYEMSNGDYIELRFDTSVHNDGIVTGSPANVYYYIAPATETDIIFSMWEQSGTSDWTYCDDVYMDTVFSWNRVPLTLNPSTDAIWLGLAGSDASICELVFTDEYGKTLLPANASDYPGLFDEQALFPERSTFRDSMYFDEIYHARTAYEFLHGLVTYENTHPPLGKIFIMLGIALFGMNPFGWRIMGTLVGIIMVPVVYLFARKLTKNTPSSALACTLFAFDFMHFTQTRLATIDVYITFFVILMYFFMYSYACMSFYHTDLKRTFLPLGACGISMGLGIACKWTGVYAGIGLALIFFGVMFRRYLEYRYAKNQPDGITDGVKHSEVIQKFFPMLSKTIIFCIAFFVLVPAVIYLLSYIPFRTYDADAGLLTRMLENQRTMFDYHSNLNATHPYSSPWYTWPLMERPIWYYSGIVTDTLREGISAFGNPLVWWSGIPAFAITLFTAIKKKDNVSVFLVIGYLAQYIPWMFVTRITFIYHYFPSIPFVVLMIVYSLIRLKNFFKLSGKKYIFAVSLYAAFVFGLFILFYPVLSGEPVDAGFVDKFLRWGKDWVLTAR